jgi:hypothetical protein
MPIALKPRANTKWLTPSRRNATAVASANSVIAPKMRRKLNWIFMPASLPLTQQKSPSHVCQGATTQATGSKRNNGPIDTTRHRPTVREVKSYRPTTATQSSCKSSAERKSNDFSGNVDRE